MTGDADVADLARERRVDVVAGAGAQRALRRALDDDHVDVDLRDLDAGQRVARLDLTGDERLFDLRAGELGVELGLQAALVHVGEERPPEHADGDEREDHRHAGQPAPHPRATAQQPDDAAERIARHGHVVLVDRRGRQRPTGLGLLVAASDDDQQGQQQRGDEHDGDDLDRLGCLRLERHLTPEGNDVTSLRTFTLGGACSCASGQNGRGPGEGSPGPRLGRGAGASDRGSGAARRRR
ncbi:MAG TPA: hypothetical protein VEA78_02090 [Acidimicrobiales bacterium]|nr:hypothetical protein [Acidimicrobiales bacterium]